MTTLIEVKDPQIVNNLRKLRLYHWEQFQKMDKWAKCMENVGYPYESEFTKKRSMVFREHATFSLQQVQVLNDLFPIGDTAEKDALENLNF